jgi:single-strand DNA-binding protein
MSSYNRVFILGTLGHELDKRSTRKGRPFCKMNLATDDLFDGSGETKTQWHSFHVFGKQAELACQYLHKGSQVFVEGKLENLPFEENGKHGKRTFLRAERVTFLRGKNPQMTEGRLEEAEPLDPEDEILN